VERLEVLTQHSGAGAALHKHLNNSADGGRKKNLHENYTVHEIYYNCSLPLDFLICICYFGFMWHCIL